MAESCTVKLLCGQYNQKSTRSVCHSRGGGKGKHERERVVSSCPQAFRSSSLSLSSNPNVENPTLILPSGKIHLSLESAIMRESTRPTEFERHLRYDQKARLYLDFRLASCKD